MKEISLTITGMRHYYGNGIFHVGDILRCRKEPENQYDAEAIQVMLPVYGKVGYIANSPYTVAKGTLSAGRAYELITEGETVEFPAERYFELFEDLYSELAAKTRIDAFAIDTQGETIVFLDKDSL